MKTVISKWTVLSLVITLTATVSLAACSQSPASRAAIAPPQTTSELRQTSSPAPQRVIESPPQAALQSVLPLPLPLPPATQGRADIPAEVQAVAPTALFDEICSDSILLPKGRMEWRGVLPGPEGGQLWGCIFEYTDQWGDVELAGMPLYVITFQDHSVVRPIAEATCNDVDHRIARIGTDINLQETIQVYANIEDGWLFLFPYKMYNITFNNYDFIHAGIEFVDAC